jgi:hypothetical protein
MRGSQKSFAGRERKRGIDELMDDGRRVLVRTLCDTTPRTRSNSLVSKASQLDGGEKETVANDPGPFRDATVDAENAKISQQCHEIKNQADDPGNLFWSLASCCHSASFFQYRSFARCNGELGGWTKPLPQFSDGIGP